MGRPKALGSAVLPEEEVRADRKKAKRYDLWAVGEKALYVGTNWTPRKYYIPYSSIRRVFKRVAVSPGSGKAFLTPILYLVVQYDDGKEHQSTFKYLQDADNLLNQLEKEHPEISLLSPEGEAKKKERQEQERRAAANELSVTAQKAKHRLETAQRTLEKQPALTRALAQSARMKRTLDLIDPKMQAIAIAVAAAGLIAIAAGLILIPLHGNTNVVILMILAGFAAVFMMINSRVLPTRRRNKKGTAEGLRQSREQPAGLYREARGFPTSRALFAPVRCKADDPYPADAEGGQHGRSTDCPEGRPQGCRLLGGTLRR